MLQLTPYLGSAPNWRSPPYFQTLATPLVLCPGSVTQWGDVQFLKVVLQWLPGVQAMPPMSGVY